MYANTHNTNDVGYIYMDCEQKETASASKICVDKLCGVLKYTQTPEHLQAVGFFVTCLCGSNC